MTSHKERIWLSEYLKHFDATRAARAAEYKNAKRQGYQKKQKFAEVIANELEARAMSADEAVARMAAAARFDISPYLKTVEGKTGLDVDALIADGHGWIIKGLKYSRQGDPIYELWDGQRALERIYDNVTPQLGDRDRPFHLAGVSFDQVLKDGYGDPDGE